MAINAFTPGGASVAFAVNNISARIAVPSGGSTLWVTNLGPSVAVVAMGSSSVTVTPSTGLAIPPGQSVPLGAGSNTDIAAITASGKAVLNITPGT